MFYAQAFAGKLPSLESVLSRPQTVEVGTVNQPTLVASWSQILGIKPQPISDAAQRALRLTKES